MEVLRTENLTKKFGGLAAVAHVDFHLERSEVQSIIGPNGAGKSTLFKLINGELKPTQGRIWFNGEEITGLEQHVISHKGIATSYQITNIFPKLSAFENVRLAVQSRRTSYNCWSKAEDHQTINEKAEGIIQKIGLGEKRSNLAANLSYGDQRHLEIGVALGTEPILLLMDEPTSGLSPIETRETVSLIKEIAKGLPVILVTAVTAETGISFSPTAGAERAWVGADALLAKPIRFEQLKREVERLLGTRDSGLGTRS